MQKNGDPVKQKQDINDKQLLNEINRKLQTFVFSNERRAITHTKPHVPQSHFAGHNIWLLKPASFNRGRGVHLFNTLDQLKKLLKQLSEGQRSGGGGDGDIQADYVKTSSFVIQKYIERPLLVQGRKFDIRQWVLVTNDLKCYFFKQGYIRTSATEFQMNDMDKKYVHLTNCAIQKFGDNYGQFEEGNVLTYQNLQQFYPEIDVKQKIVDKMQELVKTSMLSVRKKLNSNDRNFCFEIFGYDFMVDIDFQVWMIEVNTNPAMEQTCAFTRMLLPRMMEDTMRLTLDVIYPPKKTIYQLQQKQIAKKKEEMDEKYKGDKGKKEADKKKEFETIKQKMEGEKIDDLWKFDHPYPCQGYKDSESMWQFLVQLQRPQITSQQRIKNFCNKLSNIANPNKNDAVKANNTPVAESSQQQLQKNT